MKEAQVPHYYSNIKNFPCNLKNIHLQQCRICVHAKPSPISTHLSERTFSDMFNSKCFHSLKVTGHFL